MICHSLKLEHFRNYVDLEVEFDPRVNLIYGDNAQGKTNLLEAAAYLSAARSHRTRFDRELIMLGEPESVIEAGVFSRNREFILKAQLTRGRSRRLFSNGVKLKTAGELAGILTTVLFCPEDLYLIREGGAARRRFLDGAICQLRPRYAQALAEYNRLYEHKVRILRDWPENPSLLETLDDFNLRLCQTGALVIHYRAHFIKRLREEAPAIHQDFSGGREVLELQYQTVSTVQDSFASPQKIFGWLLEHQESHRRAELDSRQCLTGPHKDDVLVLLDGQSAKTYGSQGQTRTAALSLKLAQREIFFQETGEYPVLLLDDVLSELDPKRQSFVLNRIKGGQILITCCEEDKLEGLEGGRTFHVQGGRLI